ncbi:MAG: hypothetical protein WCC03_19815 [Candidatus Acidiferrales bacterium]
MKSRPVGIVLFAILYLLNAAFYGYLTVLGFFARDKLAAFLNTSTSPAGVGPSGLLSLGNLLPFYFVAMAAVTLVLAFGMWRLKNWARIVTMLLIGISLLDAAFMLLKTFAHFVAADFARLLVATTIGIVVLWYLNLKAVRASFSGDPAKPSTS